MPIPKPKDGEERPAFMSRCISELTKAGEGEDTAQRGGICKTAWDKSKAKKAAAFTCSCIKCGHKMSSDKHCKDLKCPKCGGQMRRAERPGPGQKRAGGGKALNPVLSIFNPDSRLEAKVEDGKLRLIGYATTWDQDLGGDRFERGSFKKTIREKVKAGAVAVMVRHFKYGGDVKELIGVMAEAKEDETGLAFVAELYEDDPLAQQTHAKIAKTPALFGCSPGWVTIRAADNLDKKGNVVGKIYQEAALYEVTITLVPANEKTKGLLEAASTEGIEERLSALEEKVNPTPQDEGAGTGEEDEEDAPAAKTRSFAGEVERQRRLIALAKAKK